MSDLTTAQASLTSTNWFLLKVKIKISSNVLKKKKKLCYLFFCLTYGRSDFQDWKDCFLLIDLLWTAGLAILQKISVLHLLLRCEYSPNTLNRLDYGGIYCWKKKHILNFSEDRETDARQTNNFVYFDKNMYALYRETIMLQVHWL